MRADSFAAEAMDDAYAYHLEMEAKQAAVMRIEAVLGYPFWGSAFFEMDLEDLEELACAVAGR